MHFSRRQSELFNLEVDVVFYNTTTASFDIDFEEAEHAASAESDEGDPSQPVSGLRKRGKSRDGTWNPQVVMALAVTRKGLPVRSWVFPGTTTDVTTIEMVKTDLRGWQLNHSLAKWAIEPPALPAHRTLPRHQQGREDLRRRSQD